MSSQLLLGIIAAAFIIFLSFFIPFILSTRKTLKSVQNFINVTQESLIPLLSELKENAKKLNNITENIESSTQNIQHLMKALGDMGTLIEEFNNYVKQTGLSFSVKTLSLGVGIKTALSTLAKGILKKGGNSDE